jgi:hypothetical protein
VKWWQIRKRDADLERELRADLELEEEEQRENGVPADEAGYAALRAFGNPTLIREQTRGTWSWNWLESLGRDLRYGVRSLRRTPGFTLIAVVVMALGIGANLAFFTVVSSVLLKPPPYRDPDRLATLYETETNRSGPNAFMPAAAGNFGEWKQAARGKADMALVAPFHDYSVSA